MQIPVDFWNLSLWLTVTAIIFLITAQLVSAYDGQASLLIDKKRLKNAALIMGILFLAMHAFLSFLNLHRAMIIANNYLR